MAIGTHNTLANKIDGLNLEVETRGFKVTIDEAKAAGGADTGMTPIELLLGSLGSCQLITAMMFAPNFGFDLEDICLELEGDLDLDSMKGLPGAITGLSEVRLNIHNKSSGPVEKLKRLIRNLRLYALLVSPYFRRLIVAKQY